MSGMHLPEPPGTHGMRDLRHGTPAILSDKIGSAISPWDAADVRGNGWRRGAALEFPQRRRQGAVCRSEAQSPGKSLAGTSRKQRVRHDILLIL